MPRAVFESPTVWVFEGTVIPVPATASVKAVPTGDPDALMRTLLIVIVPDPEALMEAGKVNCSRRANQAEHRRNRTAEPAERSDGVAIPAGDNVRNRRVRYYRERNRAHVGRSSAAGNRQRGQLFGRTLGMNRRSGATELAATNLPVRTPGKSQPGKDQPRQNWTVSYAPELPPNFHSDQRIVPQYIFQIGQDFIR